MSRRLLTLPLRAIAALAVLLMLAQPAAAQRGFPVDNFYSASSISAAVGQSVAIPLNQGQGVAAFTVTGLAASGATLAVEYSDDRGATWGSIRTIGTATAAGATTVTTDGSFTVNAAGHTMLRLRVSVGGAGSVSIVANSSVAVKEVAISGAISAGPNAGAAFAATPATANGGSALLAKNVAANLYGFDLTQGGTAGYFAFLNLAAIPATSSAITPLACVYVGAGGSLRARQDIADRYTTGLVVVGTTSCTTYTANTAALISVEAQ